MALKFMLGPLWMILAMICFLTMNTIVHAIGPSIDSFQIAFLQYFIALLIFVPWIIRSGWRPSRSPTLWKIFIARSLSSLVSTQLWLISLQHLPLVETVALGLSNVIFTAAGSLIFLHEKVTFERWAATLLGFSGVIIISWPYLLVSNWYILIPLCAAIAFSAGSLLTKEATNHVSPLELTITLLLIMTPITIIPAVKHWTILSPWHWFFMVVLGIFFASAQFSFAKAYSYGDASYVTPYILSRLPLSMLIGWIIFSEPLSLFSWIGTFFIIIAFSYLCYQERKHTHNQVNVTTK